MKEIIIVAAIGGLTFNLLNYLEALKLPVHERPNFTDIGYWVPFAIWPLLSGFLAYIYGASNISLNPMLAFNVGLSAPLILKAMTEANPLANKTIDPGEGA